MNASFLRWVIIAITLLLFSSFEMNAQQNHPTAKLEIGYNGPLDDPELPVRWVSGGIGPGHAHYSEGQSIPFRVVMKNLPVGNTITLDIGFGVVQANKYAFDFVTTYNLLNPHNYSNHTSSETIDPTFGYQLNPVPDQLELNHPFPPLYVGNFPGALESYNHFNGLTTDERSIYLWNGNFSRPFTTFYYYLVLERDIATNTVTDILDLSRNSSGILMSIEFVATSSTAILAFGGHIARSTDWGQNNVGCSPCKAGLQYWDLNNLPASMTVNIRTSESSRTGGGICSFNDGGRPINPIGEPTQEIVEELTDYLVVFPNPSSKSFNLRINSAISNLPIDIYVTDILGRVVRSYKKISPGINFQFGEDLKSGVYIIKLIQGNRRQQIKLIKQPN